MLQAPAPPAGYQSNLAALYTQNAAARSLKKTTRVLPQQPERVLDAPELLDNYYLNLLDWGSNNQARASNTLRSWPVHNMVGLSQFLLACVQVAVALGQAVFLWNANSGTVDEVAACQEGTDDHVTSVAWAADGKHLAVGTNSSVVQVR